MSKATKFTERQEGAIYIVNMPDPSALAEPVAGAVRAVADSRAALVAKRRERDAAQAALRDARNRIETDAAVAMTETGKVPKGLRKAAKAAEESLADVELEVRAATTAFHTHYATLRAVLDAQRDKVEARALKSAESALTRLAAARHAFEVAAADAADSFGLLGMYRENERENVSKPIMREPLKSRRAFAMSAALQALAQAVGESKLDLDEYRTPAAPSAAEAVALDDPGALAAAIKARRAAEKAASNGEE